jgi:hypothetical protein
MRPRKWLTLAARSILLDRWAYRQAAFNPYMTAPAIAIALVMSFLVAWISSGALSVGEWVTRFGSWLVQTLFVFGAARLLGGKSDFTTTLRATGFAQMAYLLELFSLLPPLAALSRIAAFLVAFLATWLAATEAQKLRGWRTLLLPFAVFVISIASSFILNILWRGAEMSVDSLVRVIGLLPR